MIQIIANFLVEDFCEKERFTGNENYIHILIWEKNVNIKIL